MKTLIRAIIAAGFAALFGMTMIIPASAMSTGAGGGGGVPANCTLNPFNHTQTCHNPPICHKDKNGRSICVSGGSTVTSQ